MTWRRRSTSRSEISYPDAVAFVYIVWGLDESRPLYVGKTRAYHVRMANHQRVSKWFPFLRRVELYAFPSEQAALIAEAEAIEELTPDYNQAGNRGRLMPLARYLRRRPPPAPVPTYGPPITLDEFSPEQLAIIARVQDRGEPS